MKKIILFILVFLLVCFLLPDGTIYSYHFQTENKEYEYVFSPQKGDTFVNLERDFNKFKEKHGNQNLYLCRTFEMQVWKCWKWRDYLFNPVWRYPYCNQKGKR